MLFVFNSIRSCHVGRLNRKRQQSYEAYAFFLVSVSFLNAIESPFNYSTVAFEALQEETHIHTVYNIL